MTRTASILVTGPRGLLGSTLLRTLGNAQGLAADLRDGEAVRREVQACAPAWIVHTAAKTNVAECERDPGTARAVNVGGTEHLLDASRAVGARFIYISTVSVFPGREGNYREDDAPEPVNTHNLTKREAEIATLAYDQGMVLRLNLIGVHPDGSRGKNFMEWLVDAIRADKDLTLFNDQYINPLSNWTTASFIRSIIERNLPERILHIGASDRFSKADIGKMVLARFPDYRGTVTEKSIDTIADGVIRPKQMWLNCDTAARLLGPLPAIAGEIDAIFSRQPF